MLRFKTSYLKHHDTSVFNNTELAADFSPRHWCVDLLVNPATVHSDGHVNRAQRNSRIRLNFSLIDPLNVLLYQGLAKILNTAPIAVVPSFETSRKFIALSNRHKIIKIKE